MITRRLVLTIALVAGACAGTRAEQANVLRVCADPNNLPFSNDRGEGLENRLVEMVAQEMGARVEYTWHAQRRGFVRETLRSGLCDVIAGVPSSFELALPTRPYYRSTYVFVYPKDAPFEIRSFDDDVLRELRIGVHLVGDDGANTPPAHALGKRGIIGNVHGYMLYGDYSKPDPPADILTALANDEIDVAIVWGPLAGYFVPRMGLDVEIVPVSPQVDLPFLPFVFDIAMGVRRDDVALKERLDSILERRSLDVEALLVEYGVPRPGAQTQGVVP